MLYKTDPVSDIATQGDLVRFVLEELRKIEVAISLTLPQQMEVLHVAPDKPRECMIVAADGTDWNPGAGKGVYAYYSSAYHKLG